MFKEKGTLPLGVEFGGEVHKDFTLSPLRIGDSIAARKALADDPRLAGDEEFGLYLLARRLVIGTIPPEAMTLDLMIEMFEQDIANIQAAERRSAKRLGLFPGDDAGASNADAGAAQGGDTVGSGGGDDGAGGAGVAGGLQDDQESSAGREGEDVQGAASP